MRGRYAGETGIAAAGAVEVRLVGGRVREEGAADQVAHAARLERPGGLEVFELEEDAAAGCFGLAIWGKGAGEGEMYVPSCSFGQSGGLDQWGRDPGLGIVRGW